MVVVPDMMTFDTSALVMDKNMKRQLIELSQQTSQSLHKVTNPDQIDLAKLEWMKVGEGRAGREDELRKDIGEQKRLRIKLDTSTVRKVSGQGENGEKYDTCVTALVEHDGKYETYHFYYMEGTEIDHIKKVERVPHYKLDFEKFSANKHEITDVDNSWIDQRHWKCGIPVGQHFYGQLHLVSHTTDKDLCANVICQLHDQVLQLVFDKEGKNIETIYVAEGHAGHAELDKDGHAKFDEDGNPVVVDAKTNKVLGGWTKYDLHEKSDFWHRTLVHWFNHYDLQFAHLKTQYAAATEGNALNGKEFVAYAKDKAGHHVDFTGRFNVIYNTDDHRIVGNFVDTEGMYHTMTVKLSEDQKSIESAVIENAKDEVFNIKGKDSLQWAK